MYAQQSTHSQSTTQPTTQQSTTQQSSGLQTMAAGADSQQATSNQALLEDAGLTSQEGEGDSMLGMVLECLPLEAAVPMAASHIEDPGVMAWARRQDLVSVAKVAARWRPDLLEAQWPAGIGICTHGTLGGSLGLGGDIEASTRVLRQEDGSFAVTTSSEFKVDVGDDTGVSLMVSGVDPELFSGFAATAGVGVGVDFEGNAVLSGTELLLAGLANFAMPGVAAMFLAGARILHLADDAGWLHLGEAIDLPDMQTEVRAFAEAEAREAAGLQPAATIPGVLAAVSDTLRVLARTWEGLADLKQNARVEVIAGSGPVALQVEGTANGLLELATCELLAHVLDSSLMAAAAERFGADAHASLYLPIVQGSDTADLQPDPDGASITFEIGASHGETAVSDSLCVPLHELVGILRGDTGVGEGLAAMLNGVELSRAVELPADPSLVDNVVADELGKAIEAMGGAGVIGGIDTLRLVGRLTARGDTMRDLAQAGIQAPPELGPVQALRDIHDALCAAATGTDGVADWLQPWGGAIAAAARSMTLEAPRIQGELRVGVGGSLSASMVKGASGKARGTVGLVVDQPADEFSDARVREALARGVFRSPEAPSTEQSLDEGECEQPVEEPVCEQDTTVSEQTPAEPGTHAQTSTTTIEQPPAPETAGPSATVQQPTEHADTGTETTDSADKNGKDGKGGTSTTVDPADTSDSKDSTDKNGKDDADQPFQLPRALRRFQRRTDIGAPKGPTRQQ
ncbi:MAG: hypothetical protein D6798_11695 [Deltaproteobacteria bacterium]|nr:MAG: hypothetical protein D6798_11695 [Deltaproteobacteria bacterium]